MSEDTSTDDGTDDGSLSRRSLLAATGIGAAGITLGGAGTFALLSDTERTQTDVQSGTLDLTMDGDNGTVSTSLSLGPLGSHESGEAVIPVQNTGNLPGVLGATVGDVTGSEGANPESETNTSTADGGELAQYVDVELGFDRDGDLSTGSDRAVAVARSGLNGVASGGLGTTDHALGAGGGAHTSTCGTGRPNSGTTPRVTRSRSTSRFSSSRRPIAAGA